MRRASRVDTTHAAIRDALRKLGASVLDTHALGDSFPDLVVGFRGRTFLIECKWQRPTRGPYSGGSHKETAGQRRKREAWEGDEWLIATSPEQAVEAVSQHVRARLDRMLDALG